MKQATRLLGALLFAAAIMWSGVAPAQVSPPVDFDSILQDLPGILDDVLDGNWSGGLQLWQRVPNMTNPNFAGEDNFNNTMLDEDQLALLQAVLNGEPCVDALAPTTVTSIRNSFEAGKEYITNRPNANVSGRPVLPGIQLVLRNVRVTALVIVDVTTDVRTGHLNIISAFGQNIELDLESLWGTFDTDTQSYVGGLLDDADPRLDDALINVGAAIMTLGDTQAIDFFQSLVAEVVIGYVPVLIAELTSKSAQGFADSDIKQYVDSGETWIETPEDDPALNGIKYTIDCTTLTNFDETVDVDGISARIRWTAANQCISIQAFINEFNCTAFTCLAARLATSGDLNDDGTSNLNSYFGAGSQRPEFLAREWVNFADPINFTLQPVSLSILEGNPATFDVEFDTIATEPYDVQWYSGSQSDGSDLTPISGEDDTLLSLPVQNTGGTTYYQCQVSDPCGNTTASNLVSLLVEPLVVISGQPAGATIELQTNYDLTVTASVSDGGLEYQWQKFNTGLATWENLVGANAATYSITNAAFAAAGQYRCVVDSDTYTTTATSTTATITVTVPQIIISLQPVGGEFEEGDPVNLTVAATIALTPPDFSGTLSYVWFKNGINTGVTGDTFAIPSFALADEGSYFARITSNDFPSGPNQRQVNSSEVNLFVASGIAFRVDQSAPRPGNNPPGSTWEDAFETIQEGINAANAAGGGEVWVAGGPGPVYYVYNEVRTEVWGFPEQADGSLVMKDNVGLYGGFEGYTGPNGPGTGLREVVRSQRSVHNVPTTISGAGTRDGGTNDAYHVVVFGRPNARTLNARIDGFTITGGRALGGTAPGDYHSYRGAGIYNYGSAPTIANCTFTDNVAEVAGGAIANEDNDGIGSGNAAIVNCVFYNNTANRGADAAASAVRGGGAIFNNKSNATVQFSTIFGNAVGNPGFDDAGVLSSGIYSWESSPFINSNILWGNTAGDVLTEVPLGDLNAALVSFSNIEQGVLPGAGNISSDPLFATFGPEFLLGPGSPSLGTADPGLAGAVTADLRGVPRPQPGGGQSDQGAFESVVAPTVVCADADLTLSPLGVVTLNATQLVGNTTDAPALIWKALVDDGGSPARTLPLDCTDVAPSPFPVTLTIIDLAGNVDTCIASVSVFDETDPVAVCQDISVSVDAITGTYTLTAAEIDGGSSDVCGAVTLSIPPTEFTCSDVGQVVVVELTVEDASGNTDTCFANVTVQDTSGPIMNVVPPAPVELDANGQGSITVADVDDGIFDTCGTVSSITLSQSSFTCADLGVVNVTVTATDNLGNESTAIVPVTVEDNIDPVITLTGPSAVNVLIDTPYVEQGAVANDNCDGQVAAVVGGDVVDTSVETSYTVTYNYVDGSGNVADQVLRTVTIITNPPAVITILGDNPAFVECGVDSYQDAGATAEDWDAFGDPLGDISDQIITTGLPIDTTTPGTQIVTYEVTDDAGTVTIETRDVVVQDNIAPVITVLGNNPFGIAQGDTFTDPGVSISDACDDSITPIVGGDVVDTNVIDTYVITYDAFDSEGNPAVQQTRTVVVVEELLDFVGVSPDVEAYVDDPAFDITATFSGGSNPTTYTWTEAGLGVVDSGAVSGNEVSLTITPGTGGGETPVGSYAYTASVTDDTGETSASPISVGIFDRLSIGQDIADAEITLGDDFSMTFGVNGGIGTLNYQWQVDADSQAKATWVDLADTGNISGSNSDTLTFTGFLEENQGAYQCVVEDSGSDSIGSSVAVLTASAGVPAAGVLGLMGLALLSALGGASAIRRRK